jgi:hydroxymethylbilane synthase
LRKLEGGCSIPAFGHAVLKGDSIELTAGLANLNGSWMLKKTVSGKADDPESLGSEVGDFILDNNGRETLAEIKAAQAE